VQAARALKHRAWITNNSAEGLEPDHLYTTASRYYERRMRMFKAMDFDEMLRAVEELLATSKEALEIARRYHEHLLVDEFQARPLFECCDQHPVAEFINVQFLEEQTKQ
jgi:superfamily I DNA/RNA helicase